MSECKLGKGWAGCKLGEAVDSTVTKMGEAMMAGWDSLMKDFLTSWLKVGLLVDLDAGSVEWLTAQLQVTSIFLAVIGIMIAAVWTMIHYRGEKAIKVAQSLFKVVLVTTIGVAVVQVVIAGGDAFSTWILDSAGITVDARAQIPVAALAASNPALAILAGIFGIIATIIQWGIMLVRSALLPLLVGVWPAAAAASMIGGAEQAFSKITTWIIAFALYKPIAAIIYAYSWKTKSGGDGIGGVINGLVLIVLAVVALPAMMRLLAPGTAALGGSGGGSMALAGGAALVGAGVAAGTAVISGGSSAAASGAASSAGAAKTAGGTGSAAMAGAGGPSGTAGGTDSGRTGSGVTGGESSGDAGGTAAEAMGAGDNSGGAGGTGSGTIGDGDSASGTGQSTKAETDTAGGGSTPSGTTGEAGNAAGTQTPSPGASPSASAESGTSGSGSAGGTNPPPGSPDATPVAGNGNTPSKAKQVGTAAAQSMSQAVADGAKDADGKDVIGE